MESLSQFTRVLVGLLAIAAGVETCYSDPLSNGPDNMRGPITLVAGRDPSGRLGAAVQEWNREHPGETVTMRELSQSADKQRITIAQSFQIGSSAYDVALVDVAWVAEFAAQGWLEPLDERKFANSSIVPAAARTARFHGKLFAAPYGTMAGILFYRSDLISSPPKTWSELKTLCRTVAMPNGIDCYAGQLAEYEGLTVNVAEAIASAGGSLIANDGVDVTVDSTEARTGLGFLAEGLSQGWIPSAALTYGEEESRRAFQQGRLLLLRNWPNIYNLINAPGPGSVIAGKVGVAPLPGPNGIGKSILGGKNFVLSKFSRNKATARDWLEFMQSEAVQREINDPVLIKLYDDTGLQQRLPFLPVLKDILLDAVSRPSSPNYHAVSRVIQKDAYAALQGRNSVDDAVADIADGLTKALASRY
jgi:multiple sugar transport system substrate-binding protein